MEKARVITLFAIIGVATVSRLLPHPANVAPITAMAIFGGFYFREKWFRFLAPLLAMGLSDFVLGFHRLMPIVYGCFILAVCLGMWARQKGNLISLAGATLTSSVIFFSATNLGVWWFEGMYPRTSAGLATCFVAAIPFFRNTILGDFGYLTMMVASFYLAKRIFPRLEEVPTY